MKKLTALLLTLALLLPLTSLAMGFQMPTIALPEDSTVFSPSFAVQAVSLCQTDPQALALLGLRIVHQANFDKAADDAAHTSAYTVAQGAVQHKGETRPLFIVIVRATEGGEWYSNFDFAPSRDNSTQYAENFYAAAQDIYASVTPVLAAANKPLVVLTGYSRGAACANLLGMLLNADYGVENVYVYTAATPNTVRGEAAQIECPNIFNVINPADLITHLPLTAWGYQRLGQDVVLPADAAITAQIEGTLAQLAAVAPDISGYYTTRYSLTSAGEGPFGLTTYEVMLRLADQLMGKADPSTAAALQMLSPASSFAPIMQLFLTSADDPASMMNQHAPAAYTKLFGQYQMMQLMGY